MSTTHVPAGRRAGRHRRGAAMLVSAGLLAGALLAMASGVAHAANPTVIGPMDWPMYGHDTNHSFVGTTTLDEVSAKTLAPAWFFPTGDAVTAQPIVVAGVVYVGSWDGYFYAINASNGSLLWKYKLDCQGGVHPDPCVGRTPADATTDGGIVTSTAFFLPGDGANRPDLVIFGGGFTLYALCATTVCPSTGTHLYWKYVYSGAPESPPNAATDPTRQFSSPVVVGNQVLFSVSADQNSGYRGYMASANLADGTPTAAWGGGTGRLELDTAGATPGTFANDGCGNVWSSPTVEAKLGIEVVGTSDCGNKETTTATAPHAQHVLGVNIANGTIAWEFIPQGTADQGQYDTGPPKPGFVSGCDFDVGATPNLGTDANGNVTFLGVGRKDGTYYSLDVSSSTSPGNWPPRWHTNVVFGGNSGGFIGSAAFDGTRVYGATAFGDFNPPAPPCTGNPPAVARDTQLQDPSLHSFNAFTNGPTMAGSIAWQQMADQSFGSTTEAGGMTFVGADLVRHLVIDDAATGNLVHSFAGINSDSGIVPVGNALFFGTGSSEMGVGDGVFAYTPLGVAPSTGPVITTPEWPLAPATVLVIVLAIGALRTIPRGQSRVAGEEC